MAASFRWILQLHKHVLKAARFYAEGLDFTVDVCTLRWAELRSGSLKLALMHSPKAKKRHQFLLKGEAVTARLIHCCCEPCALCQEYRELQHRGLDMVVGWHRNVEQRKHKLALTTATAPTVEPAMTR